MKKYKQVYCTCCVYGNKLIESLYKETGTRDVLETCPLICRTCYPWDMEDSRPLEMRKNYKESLSGWWWLTKRDIINLLKRILFKIRKKTKMIFRED